CLYSFLLRSCCCEIRSSSATTIELGLIGHSDSPPTESVVESGGEARHCSIVTLSSLSRSLTKSRIEAGDSRYCGVHFITVPELFSWCISSFERAHSCSKWPEKSSASFNSEKSAKLVSFWTHLSALISS
ncbi:hypothetical protein ACHAXS_009075, partial [Conticribra weissflogii]